MEIVVGSETIKEIFVGDMGIKEIYVGDEFIYQRQGGYLYLELDTSDNTD